MTENFEDPIIDACLDEVLGGQAPPKLADRILRAWDDATNKGSRGSSITSLAAVLEPTQPADANMAVTVRDPKRVGASRREASRWLAIAASLTVIGLGGAFVWMAWNAIEQPSHNPNQIAAPELSPRPSQVSPVPQPSTFAHVPPAPRREAPAPTMQPTPAPGRIVAIDPAPSTVDQERIFEVDIPDERPSPLADDQIVLAINQLIRNDWQRQRITPANPVSDEQWCERVYLKLIGRQPQAEELAAFIASRAAKKREQLVDSLLEGETYIEEFAAHWSRTWTDILLASGDKRVNREGLEQYLRRAFGQGKPFNDTTYELLTATGSSKIGDTDYNGATNFLVAHSDSEGVHTRLTAQVVRSFMGLSLECSQCHLDSTWSGNEQQRFWELNAFFQQLKIDRKRDPIVSDADATYPAGETYYALPNGLIKVAYPVFVDGTEISRHPSIEKVNRRDLLAKFVTRSEQFRQAMANRFWAELFGVGFTIPADNIGPHNPPSHPELLAKLGGQFAAHDYDVRALIRWIALSDPFALSSGQVATHDQIGSNLVFDRFPLTAGVRSPVLDQLRVAKEAYASFVNKSETNSIPARVNPTVVPGAVPAELADVDKLLATVGTEARQLSKATVYGSYILDSNMSLEQKIQHMFFATLHRAPTSSEQKAVEDVLANSNVEASKTVLEFIWWALASSEEAR